MATCGTVAGHAAHYRHRTEPCDACRAAVAEYGVVLEQPAQVAKAAFDAEVARIEQHAPFVLINGRP